MERTVPDDAWTSRRPRCLILPGEVRAIALTATNDRDESVEPKGPVTIRGTLEWSGGRLPFEQRFD